MSTEYLNNRVFEQIINRFQRASRMKSRCELIMEDLEDTIYRKAQRATEDDLNLLERHSDKCDNVGKEFTEAQKELALAFYTLSENIVRYAKFGLIDSDDQIQEGVMICFEKIDRFDPKKGKAFNYMTTCILNHFRQMYRTSRNYNELKRKYQLYLQRQTERTVIKNGRETPIYGSELQKKDQL